MKKIDVHAHFGLWHYPIPPSEPTERLLRLCQAEQVEFMVCSSALALQYDMQAGNAEMAEAFADHPQLLGYVYVNPNFLAESVAEMERYLPLEYFVGCKIHPRLSGTAENTPQMRDLIAEVACHSPVLLMHTVDQNAARQMGRYASQFPHVHIILGHAAHTDSDAAAQVAAAHKNIYLDFCCEWPGNGKVERAVHICGAEKIVFGTDADLLSPAFTLGMFEDAGLSDAQLRMVYRENAARLFDLP